MKNIQYIDDNNTVIGKQIVKGCVDSCHAFAEGDSLVIATIPRGALVTNAYVVIANATETPLNVTVDIGVRDIGHNMATYNVNVVKGGAVLPIDPTLTVAKENVVVTLDEALPAGSSICVLVEYVEMGIVIADSAEEEPDLCACVTDCNVYGN